MTKNKVLVLIKSLGNFKDFSIVVLSNGCQGRRDMGGIKGFIPPKF